MRGCPRDAIRGYIARHHGCRGDDGPITNGDALQHRTTRAKPDVVSNDHGANALSRRRLAGTPARRRDGVAIEVRYARARGDQAAVADPNGVGHSECARVADKGAAPDDDLRVGLVPIAEGDRRLARQPHVVANLDAAVAAQIGQLLHPEAAPDSLALAAKERLIPEEAQDPEPGFAKRHVKTVERTEEGARQRVDGQMYHEDGARQPLQPRPQGALTPADTCEQFHALPQTRYEPGRATARQSVSPRMRRLRILPLTRRRRGSSLRAPG